MKLLGSLLLGSLLVVGCGKTTVPPQVATPVQVQAVQSQSPTVEGPTTRLEQIGAVSIKQSVEQPKVVVTPTASKPASKPSAKSKVSVSTKQKSGKAKTPKVDKEKAAYFVAMVNKAVYLCYTRLYDLIGPPPAGAIPKIAANHKGFADQCAANGIIKQSDFAEFKGKV